jgi:hypothetical protein
MALRVGIFCRAQGSSRRTGRSPLDDRRADGRFWGLVGGSALLIGAGIAWVVRLPQRLIAGVMAIGSGVLLGNLLLAGASAGLIALITSIAAGAILSMLVDTMIPEAPRRPMNFRG